MANINKTNSTNNESIKDNKDKVDVENSKPTEDNIVVPRGEFSALVEKVRQLEEGGVKKISRVKEGQRTAKIRVQKEMPVVSIQNYITKKIMTPSGEEERLSAEIFCQKNNGDIVSGGREDFLEFLNESEVATVQLDKVAETVDKSYSVGVAKAENPNPVQNLSFQSFDVDMEVEIKEKIYSVTVLDGSLKGKTFNINEKALNL